MKISVCSGDSASQRRKLRGLVPLGVLERSVLAFYAKRHDSTIAIATYQARAAIEEMWAV